MSDPSCGGERPVSSVVLWFGRTLHVSRLPELYTRVLLVLVVLNICCVCSCACVSLCCGWVCMCVPVCHVLDGRTDTHTHTHTHTHTLSVCRLCLVQSCGALVYRCVECPLSGDCSLLSGPAVRRTALSTVRVCPVQSLSSQTHLPLFLYSSLAWSLGLACIDTSSPLWRPPCGACHSHTYTCTVPSHSNYVA